MYSFGSNFIHCIVFLGCLSEDLFATSIVSSNENAQDMRSCKRNKPQSEQTDTDAINKETNDVCISETCVIDCVTESSANGSFSGTNKDNQNCSKPTTEQNEPFQGFIEGLKETLSQSDQKTRKMYEHEGARPKVMDKSKKRQELSNTHLSNKKRKELAKKEKKKRREERRKDNTSSCIDPTVAGEQTASCSVPDLGVLAI